MRPPTKTRDLLSRKLVQRLKEADKIQDPASRALARTSIRQIYGVPLWSTRVAILGWILLIAAPFALYRFVSPFTVVLSEGGLFAITGFQIGVLLLNEGQISEAGFLKLFSLGLAAFLTKIPGLLARPFKPKPPSPPRPDEMV